MKMEQVIKEIIRSGGTREQKAEVISKISNLEEEKTLKGLKRGGEGISDVYVNVILENRK